MNISSRYFLFLLFISILSYANSIKYLKKGGKIQLQFGANQFYLDMSEFKDDNYIYISKLKQNIATLKHFQYTMMVILLSQLLMYQ